MEEYKLAVRNYFVKEFGFKDTGGTYKDRLVYEKPFIGYMVDW